MPKATLAAQTLSSRWSDRLRLYPAHDEFLVRRCELSYMLPIYTCPLRRVRVDNPLRAQPAVSCPIIRLADVWKLRFPDLRCVLRDQHLKWFAAAEMLRGGLRGV
jgi:hypothetical protein